MDMFAAVHEGAQEESAANDVDNLMVTERWLHRNWIEREEEVSIVGEHADSRVARKHVVQLANGLDGSECFAPIR